MTSKQRLLALGLACGLSLVTANEGYNAYSQRDPVGIPTTCFGDTTPDLQQGHHSRAECEELAAEKLIAIDTAIAHCVQVPLTAHQRAAFASLAYNVGTTAFCRSTIVRKLNARDYTGACNEMLRWVYARGRKLPGLVKRRAQERDVCLQEAA